MFLSFQYEECYIRTFPLLNRSKHYDKRKCEYLEYVRVARQLISVFLGSITALPPLRERIPYKKSECWAEILRTLKMVPKSCFHP